MYIGSTQAITIIWSSTSFPWFFVPFKGPVLIFIVSDNYFPDKVYDIYFKPKTTFFNNLYDKLSNGLDN